MTAIKMTLPRAVYLLRRVGKECPLCGHEFEFTPLWAEAAKKIGLSNIKAAARLTHNNNPTQPTFAAHHMITVEHITPRVFGGSNRNDNLTLLCMTCNTTKTKSYKWRCQQCGENRHLDIHYCYVCGTKAPHHVGIDYRRAYEATTERLEAKP